MEEDTRTDPFEEESCLNAALLYSAKGLHVFPVRGKRPLTQRGLLEATTDPSQIVWWWEKWPDAGVAIACEPSRLVVFDCDGKEGIENFKKFVGDNTLPEMPLVRTPRDGLHLYFAMDEGEAITSSVALLQGVDMRARGAYVCAPPTLHENGKRYRWAGGRRIA